jgi:Ran GTPase-activating protein (RanGAP) involved in mRNA processing and transport
MLKGNGTLTDLSLGANHLAAKGVHAVSQALMVNDTLAAFDLHDNGVGPQGAGLLADALKYNGAISSLDLRKNGVGEDGMALLVVALATNMALNELNLRNNCVGDKGGAMLADCLRDNKTLTSVDLAHNGILQPALSRIGKSLTRNVKVVRYRRAITKFEANDADLGVLELGGVGVGDEGSARVAVALRGNRHCRELNLRANGVTAEGAAALGAELEVEHNATLTTLNLRDTALGDDGVRALADAQRENLDADRN